MNKAPQPCIYRRSNGRYYFRRAVPKALVASVGRREWKWSLDTTDAARARVLGAERFADTEREIRRLRPVMRASTTERAIAISEEDLVAGARARFGRIKEVTVARTRDVLRGGRIDGSARKRALHTAEQELTRLGAERFSCVPGHGNAISPK